MSVIIIDEDCTITNLIVPGTGGCQSHGQQKVSVMTSASVYCNTSFSLSLYVTLTCCICPESWGPPVSRPDVAPAKCPLTLDEFSATSHLQCPCHETETSHYVMSGDHTIDPGACHDTDHGLGLGPGVSQTHITSRLQRRVRTVAKIVLRINLNTGGVSK